VDSFHPLPVFGDSTASSLLDHEKDQDYSGRLNFNWEAGPGLRGQNTLSGNGLAIDFRTVYLGWAGDTITENYRWQTLTAQINSSVIIKFGSADLVAGFDGRYDSLVADKYSAQTGDTTWNARQWNVGGWLEAKNAVGPVILNPSLRLDRNSGYGYFFSPQIGIVYSTTPDLRIKTSLGRAFRAPGFNDLYSPLYGNRDLKPETGNSAELRFELGTANTAFSALSLFVREINDRIAWLPTQGGMWRPQNVNHLAIRGVEWETRYTYQKKISVENQITYLHGLQTNRELTNADGTTRDTTREAAFIPPLALSSRWDIRLPAGMILNIGGSYTSARKNYYENWDQFPVITMDTKILKAFFVFNAGLMRTFGRVSASVGCKNLLDEKYATQFGNTVDDLDYPMPPRTYYFQMVLE
jgi:outer membrane cobalamin receptor